MAIVIQTVSDSAQARRDLTQLKESVQGIQKSSEGLTRNFANFTKALVVGGGLVATISAFTKYSDAITNLENRLRFVTGSAQNATNAFAAISKIAISTRNDIDSTARLYSRLSVAAREMGANQRQVAIVTKAVGQAIKLSGANSVEAANAIQQFAQAMGSGKLQGDEFRAIMEAAPSFAYEIAKGMGVSVSQMYALKEAGLLTNKLVFEAILKRTKDINAEFSKMNVTYGEAFTNLGNSLLLLFAAVKKSFIGSSGGFAVTINGWAKGIANFAQNFSFHLLRAQTRAYVFVVDTINMFVDLWKGIKDGAKVLWDILRDFVSSLQPYLNAIGGFFIAVASKIYDGSTSLFFKFTAMLKKNDMTSALGEWLERTNSRLLVLFEKMGAVIAKFDFSGALAKARTQLINFYKSLQNIDFSSMGKSIVDWFRNFDLTEALRAFRDNLNRMFSRLGQLDFKAFGRNVANSIRKAFEAVKALNIMDYIPSLDQALETIRRWAKAVVGLFAWIYDEVIGHSYIPDLVKGIIKWLEQLSGKPLSLVLTFAGAVTAAFSAISFGNPFEGALGAIKKMLPYALGIAAAAGVAGVAYKFSEENGGAVEALKKLKGAFSGMFQDFIGGLNKIISRIGSFAGGLFDTAKTTGKQATVVARDATKDFGFYKMFPEKYQVAVGVGIAAALAGAIMLFFEKGTFRSVLISVVTTAVAAGMGRGIDKQTIWEAMAWAFEKVLELFDKGLRKIMGTTVSKDPFGFLLLIAKTSLLFKAGREYFLGLAKDIATAPTKVAQNFMDARVLKKQEASILDMQNSLRKAEEPFKNTLASATARYNDAMTDLAKQTNLVTGQALGRGGAAAAVANKVGPLPLDAAGQTALAAVRDAEQSREAAAQAVRDLEPMREEVRAMGDAAKETRQRLRDAKKQFLDNLKNMFTGAGGAIGAGIGLQVGQDIIKGIENSRMDAAVDKLLSIGVRNKDGTVASRQQLQGMAESGDFSGLDNVGKKIAEDIVAGVKVGTWAQIGITIGTMAVGQFLGATFAAGIVGIFQIAAARMAAAQLAGSTLAGAAMGVAFTVAAIAAVALIGIMIYKNWDAIVAYVKKEFPAVFNFLKNIAENAARNWRDVVEVFRGMWDNAARNWRDVVALFTGMWTKFENGWDSISKWFKNNVITPLEKIVQFFTANPAPTPGKTVAEKSYIELNKNKYATGGFVSGPGGPTSDSIPAWLSNGEYVVNAQSTRKYFPILKAINSMDEPELKKRINRLKGLSGRLSEYSWLDPNVEAQQAVIQATLLQMIARSNMLFERRVGKMNSRPLRERLQSAKRSTNFEDRTNRFENPDNPLKASVIFSDAVFTPAFMRKLGFASGGAVEGPGGPRSDSILAWLSDGEFVVNAASTKKHQKLLEAINSGSLPAFATGGNVKKRLRGVVAQGQAANPHLQDLRVATNEEMDAVSELRAQAAHEISEARRAMSEAPTGYLRQVGAKLVAKWEQWAEDTSSLADFLGGRTSSILEGSGIKDAEDDDKKKKKAKVKKPKAPDYTAQDDLNTINEVFPELQLSMEEYLRLAIETQQSVVEKAYEAKRKLDLINKLRAGSPDAFKARVQFEKDRKEFSEKAADELAPERTPFAALRAKFKDFGANITEQFYNVLPPQFIAGVQDFLQRMQSAQKIISDPTVSQETRRLATVTSQKLVDQFEKFQEDVKLQVFGTAFEKFASVLDKAGIKSDEDQYNRATDAVRERVKALADRINQLLADIKSGVLDETQRINAQKQIDELREQGDRLLEGRNASREAGKSFASDMHQSFSQGLSEAIKTRSLKPLMGIATRFTDRVIDDFIESFLTPITGPGGPMNKLFQTVGSRVWNNGTALGNVIGGSGSENNPIPVTIAKAAVGAVGGQAGGTANTPAGAVGSAVSGILGGGPAGMQNCCCNPLGNMFGGTNGSGGGLGTISKAFGLGGDKLVDPLISSAPDVGMSFADQLLNSAPDIGDRMAVSLGQGLGVTGTVSGMPAAGGAGGMMGGMGGGAGLAGILGSIAGIFLAKLFSDGGQVGVDGRIPKFRFGGRIPRFRAGGRIPRFAGGGMLGFGGGFGFGALGIIASLIFGKKKDRKKNLLGGLLGLGGGLLTTGLLGGMGGGGMGGGGGPFDFLLKLLGMGGGGGMGALSGPQAAVGMADGGQFKGPGNGTSDSILARVSTGEFIVNAKSTAKALPLLKAINDNKMPAFATGGMVGSPQYEAASNAISKDTKAYNDNKSKSTVVNLKVVGDVSRQTRKEVVRMLPEIANGVNAENRESGYATKRD